MRAQIRIYVVHIKLTIPMAICCPRSIIANDFFYSEDNSIELALAGTLVNNNENGHDTIDNVKWWKDFKFNAGVEWQLISSIALLSLEKSIFHWLDGSIECDFLTKFDLFSGNYHLIRYIFVKKKMIGTDDSLKTRFFSNKNNFSASFPVNAISNDFFWRRFVELTCFNHAIQIGNR